ncbi:MAG TPA: ribonuclease Z [Candidatus Acidoferrum sp.]|nr:ribonuclease Z [Candidatus Acidoferrum sp.]
MALPIRITFLGTAGSTPTKERNLPSVAVEYDGGTYLFDCGEGTQRQMMIYSINPYKIKSIFISHMHGDHVIGVAGLVRTLALNKRTEPLSIYIPKGEEKKLVPLLTFDKALIGYKINIIPVKPGILLKGRGFTIGAFKLNHSVPTFGYYFKEEDRHHFIKERCQKIGIKGEMYSKLYKSGRIKIGNRTISLKDVTTMEHGRKIAYVADTRPVKTAAGAAKGANILIHEATYTEEYKPFAKQRLHSTAMESAQIAKSANAERLIIFHNSARYKRADALLKEARKVFKKTDAAYDGMQITI